MWSRRNKVLGNKFSILMKNKFKGRIVAIQKYHDFNRPKLNIYNQKSSNNQ